MYVLEWRTVSALTRVLFWYLFPLLLRNSGHKHQNNPLVSAETIRHSSAYIILYILVHGYPSTHLVLICKINDAWSKSSSIASHSSPVRSTYGMYFVGSNRDSYSAFVNAVMYAISCYIGPRHKGTRLYIFPIIFSMCYKIVIIETFCNAWHWFICITNKIDWSSLHTNANVHLNIQNTLVKLYSISSQLDFLFSS